MENELKDALRITNFFLSQIASQLDIDLETSLQIKLKKEEGEEVIKEYTLLECLTKNKALL